MLKAKILDDVKLAMKAREQVRLNALRLLTAAIKQREVDERIELDDSAVLGLIEKLIKQRKEAASQFDAGGRPESAEAERFEIKILSEYLPVQMSESEAAQVVADVVKEVGAAGLQDMGKVMAVLKPRLAGKADLSAVSGLVKKALS